MFNARALLASMLGLTVNSGASMPINHAPKPWATGKRRRKVDYLRDRAKLLHHGYPGAKLARKAFLGEVGTARPR